MSSTTDDRKVRKMLRSMTPEQISEAFMRAQSDPYCRLLNEIEATDTQQEAAVALADCRDLLATLSSARRKAVMRDIEKIIDEKPVM